MAEHIGQRQLRDDSDAVMRRVEEGESFVITRDGTPVADLVPHARPEPQERAKTLEELHEIFRRLPPIDRSRWEAQRAEADEFFGDDRIEY